MDLRLSNDPYESFRIFQGRILEQYLAMSAEFNFLVMDANQPIEAQQGVARELIASKLDLASFSTEASHANLTAVSRAGQAARPAPSLI
jgi:dTMP kinase